MPYTVIFHPLVLNDYEDAYLWYEDRQQGLGEKFLKSVRDKIETIRLQPETFGAKTKSSVREAKTNNFPFVIIFKTIKKETTIQILSVHHIKKHPSKKIRKL